jgi:hypothetical protein
MFGVLLTSYAINAMDRQHFPLLAPEVRRQYGYLHTRTGSFSDGLVLMMASALGGGLLILCTPRNESTI